jgi:hypothetical protein
MSGVAVVKKAVFSGTWTPICAVMAEIAVPMVESSDWKQKPV